MFIYLAEESVSGKAAAATGRLLLPARSTLANSGVTYPTSVAIPDSSTLAKYVRLYHTCGPFVITDFLLRCCPLCGGEGEFWLILVAVLASSSGPGVAGGRLACLV